MATALEVSLDIWTIEHVWVDFQVDDDRVPKYHHRKRYHSRDYDEVRDFVESRLGRYASLEPVVKHKDGGRARREEKIDCLRRSYGQWEPPQFEVFYLADDGDVIATQQEEINKLTTQNIVLKNQRDTISRSQANLGEDLEKYQKVLEYARRCARDYEGCSARINAIVERYCQDPSVVGLIMKDVDRFLSPIKTLGAALNQLNFPLNDED